MRRFIDIIAGHVPAAPAAIRRNSLFSLLEAAKAYEDMADAVIRFIEALPVEFDRGDFVKVANNLKITAKKLGNKRGLATWFMRYYRPLLLDTLAHHLEPQKSSMQPEVAEKIAGYIGKIKQDTERYFGFSLPRATDLGGLDNSINSFREKMEHFATVDYDAMHQIVFDKQKPEDVVRQLSQLEEMHNDSKKTNRVITTPLAGDKIVLKCHSAPDFAWWLLDRSSCTQERDAMAHCGNTASPRAGQRILSLRKHAGGDKWVPYLTFIWNPDGTLGERKGYNNHKPAPMFFPQITELFSQPWIKGLVGGAYAGDRDIKIEELTPEQQDEIMRANPMIVPIKLRVAHEGMTPEIAKEIADGVSKIGNDWYRLRGFALTDLTIEQKNELFDMHPELMGTTEYYVRHGMDEKMIDILANGIRREGRTFMTRIPGITDADRDKFFDAHPELRTVQEQYAKFGMNLDLMKRLAEEVDKNPNLVTSSNRLFQSFNLTDVTDEDKARLFARYPQCMSVKDRYEKEGMSESFMDWLSEGFLDKGFPFFSSIGFPIGDLPQEDKFKLWDHCPQMMRIEDRYKRFGMTNEVMKEVLEDVEAGDSTVRVVINRFEKEDREKLFAKYPQTMPPADYYHRLGVTPEFKEIVINNLLLLGVRWFIDNQLVPNPEYHGMTKPDAWMINNVSRQNTVIKDEDVDKLFKDHPSILLKTCPKLYYAMFGMTEPLKDYLAQQTGELGHNRVLHGGDRGLFPHDQINQRDLNKLHNSHPHLMSAENYYARYGMTDAFLKWLGTRNSDQNSPYYADRRQNHEHQPEGMDWDRAPDNFDERTKLSKRDLEKFFKAYPDEMTFEEHYQRKGLDASLLKDIEKGFEKGQHGWLRENFNPETSLKKKDLAALYRKFPKMMPFLRQIEVLPVRTVVKNIESQIEALYDSSALSPSGSSVSSPIWDGKKKQFKIDWWKDVPEFLETWGDDTIQHYAGEDPFEHWGGDEADADNMDDVLPVTIKLAIGKYAKAEYGEPEREADDDEEDDDYESDIDEIDPTDWSSVKEALKENGDGVYDALESGSMTGNQYGAEADAMDSVVNEILSANHDMEWGAFDMPIRKNSKGKDTLQWDGEFTLYFTLKEMAKFLDTEVEGEDNQCKYEDKVDFMKNKLSVTDNGFYGFDEDAALDRFIDECPQEALEGRVENPFRLPYNPKTHDRPWKKVSVSQMRKVIEEIYTTEAGRMMKKWTKDGYETADPKKLTEIFREVIMKFYGP